jgi:outer membrane protein TolC
MRGLSIYMILSLLCITKVWGQDSLTIERFISIVIEQDYGIKMIKNESVVAANENNISNAGYLPRMSLDAVQDLTINSARQEFIGNQVNEADNAQNTSFQFGVLLDWTLFDGFKMFATDKKLDLLESAGKLKYRAEVEIKVYQASLLFYSYLLQSEMQSIYEESIQLSKTRLDYIKERLENGAASKVDLLQAQMDLTADSSIFMNNSKEIALIKAEINQMLTRNANAPLIIKGELPKETERYDFVKMMNKAMESNSQLLLAKADIAIKEQERKEVISRFYPKVGIYAGYNFNQAENEVGFLLRNRTFGPSFGIRVQWNIIDQLSRFNDLKNVKLMQENASYVKEQQQLIINKELTQALSNLEWAIKNMRFELRSKKLRQEVIAITESALKAGSITPLAFREIQFSAKEANARYLQAQLDYVVAKLNIMLTTGAFKDTQI